MRRVQLMWRRTGYIFFLAYQLVWLNVIVPGHTRGATLLPGTDCECCEQSSRLCHTANRSGAPVSSPKPDRASHCAICHFAARVSLPPIIDLTLPALGFAGIVDPPVVAVTFIAAPLGPYDGRAPPSCA